MIIESINFSYFLVGREVYSLPLRFLEHELVRSCLLVEELVALIFLRRVGGCV